MQRQLRRRRRGDNERSDDDVRECFYGVTAMCGVCVVVILTATATQLFIWCT